MKNAITNTITEACWSSW